MTVDADRLFRLPDPKGVSGYIDWRLTPTGLEWDGRVFRAPWMPFACMRRICLGHVPTLGGWRLGISGPPGRITIAAGHRERPETAETVTEFRTLAHTVLENAALAGCGTVLRRNFSRVRPDFLWIRLGQRVHSAKELADLL
ncbi:MAG: hypothetical protein AAF950_10495 [Pseudomonadota bacterium]